jgi:hypothetical protein
MGVSGKRHGPADLCRRLGCPQGRSEQVWKISPPTGIRSSDCPDFSESLYRQWHPSPLQKSGIHFKILGARIVTWITFRSRADKHDVQAYKIWSPWRHGARVLCSLGIYFVASYRGWLWSGKNMESVICLEDELEDESYGFLQNWVIR